MNPRMEETIKRLNQTFKELGEFGVFGISATNIGNYYRLYLHVRTENFNFDNPVFEEWHDNKDYLGERYVIVDGVKVCTLIPRKEVEFVVS